MTGPRHSRAVLRVVTGLALATLASSSAGSAAPTTFPGPNGKIAAGVVRPGVEQGIDLVNPDGSGRTRLPVPGGTGPVWSADGKRLAYSTWPEPWVIRVARADGTDDREVLPKTAGSPAIHYSYSWSPSGTEIAYQCATGVCAVRVSDGTTRKVIEAYSPPGGSYPAWSPDGRRIAFHCIRLCVTNADGSDTVVFTPPQGTALGRFPDWSPDGTRLLLTTRGKVQTLDVDDGELRELADLGGNLNVRAHWSPDGTSVLVSHSSGVYLLRPDGSPPLLVPGGAFGDWGTSPAAMVSDARLEPKWVLSRQTGSLVLAGAASHASALSVTLRSRNRTYPTVAASVSAGQFTVPVRLPADALPGAYEVSLGGTSGGETLLTVVRNVSLAAPATGLVSRSSTTVSRGGRRLSVRFVFSVKPAAGKRPTAVWVAPSGVVRLRQRVANARAVTSVLADDERLARGRWRCRLEVGGTPLAVASVRVRRELRAFAANGRRSPSGSLLADRGGA